MRTIKIKRGLPVEGMFHVGERYEVTEGGEEGIIRAIEPADGKYVLTLEMTDEERGKGAAGSGA
jgi:hypothetical protein